MDQLEPSYDLMFRDLLKKLVGSNRQAKVNVNEDFKQTVNVSGDSWQSHSIIRNEVVAKSISATAAVDQAASDTAPASAPDVQANSGSQGYVGPAYQFNANLGSSFLLHRQLVTFARQRNLIGCQSAI